MPDLPSHPTRDEAGLRMEIVRLNKIVQALMNRAERSTNVQGSDFSQFQTGVMLEQQVHSRTMELETALWKNEKITRALRESEAKFALQTTELQASLDGLRREVALRQQAELELRQAQKLESVGRLAAGVAHEINTPVQFVNDSCYFLRDGLSELQALVGHYRTALQALAEGRSTPQEALQQIGAQEQAADIDYLLQNMPGAIEQSLNGLQRVASIVRSMKEFAHPDQKEKAYADLNRAILSTLTIARNEYKYVADVETDLGDIPPVYCFLGDLNQAVLNMVVNAAHAIEDAVRGSDQRGRITIRTVQDGDDVVISIQDTGGGIPPNISDKIFEPFFTTKDVGKGTGQGLAIARSVIVDKHQGELRFDTEPGKGTTFYIRLPIQAAIAPADETAA